MRRVVLSLVIGGGMLSGGLHLGGCNRVVNIREEVMEADDGMVRPGPFAPAVMRIHPLTHIEVVDGEKRIVLHMELRDGWGDTIKGIGDLKVHLRRSGSVTLGQDGTKWDIDIRDFEVNVSYFEIGRAHA